MSITITPKPDEYPPRMLIEIASGSAATFSSIVLYRNGVKTRTQPTPGSNAAAASDYFAPFGAPVTYTAVTNLGTYVGSATLDVDRAWLVHPSQPTFSVPFSKDAAVAAFRAIGDVTNRTGATKHQVLGSRLPVSKRSGARVSGERSVTLQTFTASEAVALDQLLTDDSPILFNLPPAWTVRFTTGWYQVGDYVEGVPVDRPGEFYREWALPIQQVVEPVQIVVQTWSWDTLAASPQTWLSLPSVWESWYALIVDSRSN